MAAVWITRFINATNSPINVSSDDGTWRPWIGSQKLERNEEYTISPQRLTDTTVQPVPWMPPFFIPKGPTVVDASYWFVGWVDFASTTFALPGGRRLKTVVGPQPNGNDWLRMFDEIENELASVEVGPRGPGWVASVDFHVTFDESAKEVRWNYWNSNGIGANILQRIDEQFRKEASNIGKALFAALFA
jgi:hypothetical protein